MRMCRVSAADFTCSRSDRTAWRADGASGDRLAGSQRRSPHDRIAPFSRWSAIGSPKLSLTMRFWRSVVVLAALWNRMLGIWDIVLRYVDHPAADCRIIPA